MLRSAIFVLFLAAPGAIAGVAADKKPSAKPEASQAARPQDKAPEKTMPFTGPAVDPKSYTIGPEDVLYVRVWREPDLPGPVSVSPDGKISMQLINEVQAAGKTPEQLTSAITQSLGKYMNHPEVNVQVATVNSKKYFISGEVLRPGAFPLAVPTRVMEALIQAGGFRDFQDQENIRPARLDQV